MKKQENIRLLYMNILAVCPALLFYWPMLLHQTKSGGDYIQHISAASRLVEGWDFQSPHMLFHALTALVTRLFGLDITNSANVILLSSVAICVILLYSMVFDKACLPDWLKVSLPTALLIVAPIVGLYWVDGYMLRGYVGINVYHNPTIILLKPFALSTLLLSVHIFRQSDLKIYRLLWIAFPLLVVLSALAKPSFILIYLPAILCTSFFYFFRRNYVNWPLLLFAIILPGLLVLFWQWEFTYSTNQVLGFAAEKSSIAFAPLKAIGRRSSWLLPKLFLGVAFPLAVLFACRSIDKINPLLWLGWLTYGFGMSLTYLLIETGPRLNHGNFVWSGQIGLFLLFAVSARQISSKSFTLQHVRTEPKLLLCYGFFLLHLLSGLFFYNSQFSSLPI